MATVTVPGDWGLNSTDASRALTNAARNFVDKIIACKSHDYDGKFKEAAKFIRGFVRMGKKWHLVETKDAVYRVRVWFCKVCEEFNLDGTSTCIEHI